MAGVSEADPLDDSLAQNDFRSARFVDRRRSHYTVLSPVLGQYALDTNVSHGDRFSKMKRALARVARLAREAGLPEAVAAEAARVMEQVLSVMPTKARPREAYEIAAVAAAVRRLGLPEPPRLWEDLAAAALGLPDDRSRWGDAEEAEAARLAALARRVLVRMYKLGIDVGRPADPFEAIPDPQLRFHAIRLYNELKEAGVPGGVAARYLAIYLASLALNRPLDPAELRRLAGEYGARTNAAGGTIRSAFTRAKVLEILSRVLVKAVMAPGPGWQLPANYPLNTEAKSLVRVATVRVRCSACGYEWDVEAAAPETGRFRPGAVALALTNLSCPRCGLRLGKVVELHVEKLNSRGAEKK